ncbi:hypothetical protein B0H14DRAFT_3090485 [Mycena olivaceomarginata]|nr:hypothetical protein B0H14DRAFT_3090485 [Mycena olivaceomarginata]
MDVELDAGGAGVAAALIKQGLMPCGTMEALAIQSFVKSLCDLHGVPYRPYLRQQFSTAYNIYLEIRRQTELPCQFSLGPLHVQARGGDELIFFMLFNMDGNDSLKRVLKRLKTMVGGGADCWTFNRARRLEGWGGRLFLRWERVDRWVRSTTLASGRWKNMINDVTSKMWGIFDETGIFLALCRHGFALVVADMVRSGELSKYPLAVVEVLLDTFGLKLGGGYDIGCHFESTLKNSELGDKARTNRFKSLVGSFHGHAHNRLCQLSFLATYVEGLGLEDLEGCERYFSRSNALAKSVRYASKFHRRQEITTFMKQIDDLEVYANLSRGFFIAFTTADGNLGKFLCDNYRQALKILQTEPALKRWMQEEGVEDYDTFHVWLEEEKEYLLGLDAGLPKKRELTLEMEYLQKLVNLEGSQKRVTAIRAAERAAQADGADYSPAPISNVARRHAIEQRNRDIELVEDLEQKLGYKMRSHIAKALQARSKAIRNAIERYNKVALSMEPPMPTLDWDQVVNYGFLGDFDLLRDTTDSISSRPWTRRSYRLAMDSYFKILRAREEIQRLNIEIKRVVTWIDNEDRFLRKKEEELKETDPLLAVQRGRSDLYHMHRFWALAKVPGFTGGSTSGTAGSACYVDEIVVEER